MAKKKAASAKVAPIKTTVTEKELEREFNEFKQGELNTLKAKAEYSKGVHFLVSIITQMKGFPLEVSHMERVTIELAGEVQELATTTYESMATRLEDMKLEDFLMEEMPDFYLDLWQDKRPAMELSAFDLFKSDCMYQAVTPFANNLFTAARRLKSIKGAM
jgi:hypothetical protein